MPCLNHGNKQIINKLYPFNTLAKAVASAVAGALFAGYSWAQDDSDDANLETVVVIGTFAGSLEKSLDVKRDAESVVDAVVASDIGKMPAVNVAEALQRVPGVTIVREAGEGQFISVRGLGPNFQAVMLNGMPLAYNENIRTSGQSGRQFRFRVLPPDLIDGIVVSKAPTVDMTEGGIGSSVEIKLLNPLDRATFIGAALEATSDDRSGATTPKGALSGSWRNDDKSFGVMGGFSFQQREVQFERFGNNWNELEADDVTTADYLVGVVVPGDFQVTLEQEKRDRISVVSGVQWAPQDNLEVDIDLLYSQFNNEIAERRLTYQTNGFWDNLDQNTAVINNNILMAGTINGARMRNTTEFSDQSHENLTFIAGLTYDLGGWTLQPKLSVSSATSDLLTPLQRIEYRTASGTGNTTFDLGTDPVGDAEIRALFTDLDMSDPATVPFRRYRIRPINSEDEDTTFKLDATKAIDFKFSDLFFSEFRTGIQLSDRARDYQRRDRSNMVLRDGLTLTDDFNNVAVPSNSFDQTIGTGQLWTSANWDRWRTSYVVEDEFDGVEPSSSQLEPSSGDLRSSYGIDEQVFATYARVNLETEIAGLSTTGIIGVRYVDTETSVDGTLARAEDDGAGGVTTVTTARTTESSYSELLPSLHLNFELSDSSMLRFSVNRTMTRPSLSELRDVLVPNSGTVSDIFVLGEAALDDPSLNLTATGGNPFLKPYTSWNIDLSYEQYFDDFGGFTAAFFHKSVDNYIASDFELRTLPFDVNDGSTLPVEILVSSPANIGDVSITGIEFGYTDQLEMGLGLSFNLTLADSELELDKSDVGLQTAGIQGISDTSFSISPFYSRGDFEINLSYTWRDDYITDGGVVVTSRPTEDDAAAFYQKAFGTLDMGMSYRINDYFDAFLQAVNLTENRVSTYVETENQLHQIHAYGRTINIGVRGKF